MKKKKSNAAALIAFLMLGVLATLFGFGGYFLQVEPSALLLLYGGIVIIGYAVYRLYVPGKSRRR